MSLIQDETMIQFLEMDEDFEEDLLEFDSPEGFGSSQDPNFLELNPLESDLLPSSLKSDLFLGENLSKSLWSIYSQGDLQIQAIFDSEHTPEDNEMINGVLREIANIEAQTKRKTTKQQPQQQQQTIVMISESASSTPQSTIQTPPSTPIADGNRPPIINAPSRPYSPTSSKQQQSKKTTTNTSSTAKANSGSVKRKSTTTTARKTDISKREPMREPVETPRRRTRRQHFEETFRLEEVLKIQVVEDDEDEEIDVC